MVYEKCEFHKLGAHFVTFLVSLLHMKPNCVFVALGKDANSGVRLYGDSKHDTASSCVE